MSGFSFSDFGKKCSLNNTENSPSPEYLACGAGFSCRWCVSSRCRDQEGYGQCLFCYLGEYCPEGSINEYNYIGASICPKGNICVNSTVKEECKAGYFCPGSVFTYLDELECKEGYGVYCPPGSKNNMTGCPAGHYCPTVSTKYKCPKDHFCRPFSMDPRPCPALSVCPAGSELPQATATGVLLAVVVMVVMGVAGWWINRRGQKKAKEHRRRVSRQVARNRNVYDLTQLLLNGATEDDTGEMVLGMQLGGFRPKTHPVMIEFRDLRVEVKKGATLIAGASGTFLHSSVNAVMGTSGSGKSSLIRALLGRYAPSQVSGEIRVNDRPIDSLQYVVTFVPQDDVLAPHLTVRELLQFSAHVRLPSWLSDAERALTINGSLELLGLMQVQDVVAAGALEGGPGTALSGGQRKRVSIGVELVGDPEVLFLDEPTSGLSSSDSAFIVKALWSLSCLQCTVVAVIHSPPQVVYSLFSCLLLMSQGGRVAYCGKPQDAIRYFNGIGFKWTNEVNPADFLLDILDGALKPKNRRNSLTGSIRDISPLRLSPKTSFPATPATPTTPMTPGRSSMTLGRYSASAYLPKMWKKNRGPVEGALKQYRRQLEDRAVSVGEALHSMAYSKKGMVQEVAQRMAEWKKDTTVIIPDMTTRTDFPDTTEDLSSVKTVDEDADQMMLANSAFETLSNRVLKAKLKADGEGSNPLSPTDSVFTQKKPAVASAEGSRNSNPSLRLDCETYVSGSSVGPEWDVKSPDGNKEVVPDGKIVPSDGEITVPRVVYEDQSGKKKGLPEAMSASAALCESESPLGMSEETAREEATLIFEDSSKGSSLGGNVQGSGATGMQRETVKRPVSPFYSMIEEAELGKSDQKDQSLVQGRKASKPLSRLGLSAKEAGVGGDGGVEGGGGEGGEGGVSWNQVTSHPVSPSLPSDEGKSSQTSSIEINAQAPAESVNPPLQTAVSAPEMVLKSAATDLGSPPLNSDPQGVPLHISVGRPSRSSAVDKNVYFRARSLPQSPRIDRKFSNLLQSTMRELPLLNSLVPPSRVRSGGRRSSQDSSTASVTSQDSLKSAKALKVEVFGNEEFQHVFNSNLRVSPGSSGRKTLKSSLRFLSFSTDKTSTSGESLALDSLKSELPIETIQEEAEQIKPSVASKVLKSIEHGIAEGMQKAWEQVAITPGKAAPAGTSTGTPRLTGESLISKTTLTQVFAANGMDLTEDELEDIFDEFGVNDQETPKGTESGIQLDRFVEYVNRMAILHEGMVLEVSLDNSKGRLGITRRAEVASPQPAAFKKPPSVHQPGTPKVEEELHLFEDSILDRKYPGFFIQFRCLTWRGWLQYSRRGHNLMLEVMVLLLGGLVVGILRSFSQKLRDTPSNMCLAATVLGVLTSVAALSSLGGAELALQSRELKRGVGQIDVTAYFLSKVLLQLFDDVLFPLFFLSSYFNFVYTNQFFVYFWFRLGMVSWAASGMGMFASAALRPASALLCAVLLPLVTGVFLGGVDPPLPEMANFIRRLADLSFARWSTESLTVFELSQEPDHNDFRIEGIYEHFGFHEENGVLGQVMLLIFGLFWRILAYAILALKTNDYFSHRVSIFKRNASKFIDHQVGLNKKTDGDTKDGIDIERV